MPQKVSSSTDYSSPRALWTFKVLCWCGRPSGSGGRHVKGGHVKVIFKRQNPGAKKSMLRRAATRTRARPRTRSTPNTSTHAYRHHPRPAYYCPPPPRPPKLSLSTVPSSSRTLRTFEALCWCKRFRSAAQSASMFIMIPTLAAYLQNASPPETSPQPRSKNLDVLAPDSTAIYVGTKELGSMAYSGQSGWATSSDTRHRLFRAIDGYTRNISEVHPTVTVLPDW